MQIWDSTKVKLLFISSKKQRFCLVLLNDVLWYINPSGLFKVKSCLYIYIYIYIYHHYDVTLARISQTLSHHSSISSIAPVRFSSLHPESVQSCCREVQTGCSILARPCERIHRSTSLMSSSLLLQLCPTCLVCLIWMIFEMDDRWTYSCYFVGSCLQNLFNIACIDLVQLPSSFFYIHLISVHVVHPYSSIDSTASRKKLCYILSD